MNCRADILKDFNSETEVMGLKCPCGNNAVGINDLASLTWPDLSLHRGIISCSIGTYTASDSAPAQTRICPLKTINYHANVTLEHSSCSNSSV